MRLIAPARPAMPDPPARPDPPMRRLFFAVPLDEGAVRTVSALLADLRAAEVAARAAAPGAAGQPGLRWVRPEGIHLTLRFLGPTPVARVGTAVAALETAATDFGPIEVRVAGAGAFPRLAAPRVLWLGVEEGTDRLADLAGRLETRLVAAGWPPEGRPFAAHLTLARGGASTATRQVAEALVRRAAGLAVAWTVDRAILFESRPGPDGARYEPLAVVPLAARAR